MFSALSEAGRHASAALAEYQSGNYVGAGKSGYAAVGSAMAFVDAIEDPKDKNELQRLIQKYRAEFEIMRSEIRAFIARSEEYQRRISLENSRVLESYLSEERAIANARRNVSLDFASLTRQAVQAFALDPFGGPATLDSHLSAIDQFISKFPTPILTVRPNLKVGGCSVADLLIWNDMSSETLVGCVSIASRDTTFAVLPLTADGRLRGLPLLVVGRAIPTTNFPVNMYKLYRRADLRDESVGSMVIWSVK